jgi:SAM-dependent MidA family methyltransferase
MDVTPGLRAVARPDLDAVGEASGLVDRIRAEIVAAGPMTFARFMELALYDPQDGYYRGPDPAPGRAGDFLTAPELHPLFGWAFSAQLDELWDLLGRPMPFTVREHGAGAGALAAGTLHGLRRSRSSLLDAIVWQPVDIEERRQEAFAQRLTEAGFGDRFEPPGTRPIVGCVLANEVLDALPVHRLIVRNDRLREVLVGVTDGAFVDVEADPTTPALQARLASEEVVLHEGQRAEICLKIDGWVAQAAAGLGRGALLLIDYGYPATELYDPIRRRDGTLRAYLRHTVHDDPYRHVGRQDLTAHVDVTAVERAAADAGLETLGLTTQAEFLAALDAGELLRSIQDDPAATLEGYLEARAAIGRMIDPAAMGRFRVILFGRGLPVGTNLRGLRPLREGRRAT